MIPDVESSLLLLERARGGDAGALDELLLRYLPRMRKWASGRLPPSARHLLDTEDIVQETLVKALRNLSHLEIRDGGALQAYLRQALTNRLADLYRRSRTHPRDTTVGSDLAAHDASPLEAAIGLETLRRYEEGLARLKAEDRQAVILRVELSHDYDEIAGLLGKSCAAAARVAVSRALARLSREMKRDGR
jgi:RNA polymerase sigma-70 factor (ECF subfamily)